jgi:hypothetical protein
MQEYTVKLNKEEFSVLYIKAMTVKIIDGCLIFYDISGEIQMAFAPGEWRTCQLDDD